MGWVQFAAPAVLLVPATAAVVLALLPSYRLGAGVNVAAALVTFGAGLTLLEQRPAPGQFLLVDDLNVFLIVLNTFVGFTTSVFSASYIAHELETGRLTPGLSALLSRDVPDADVRHEPGAARQQYRPDVGGDRTGDADDGVDGGYLSDARGAGSGVEVLHSRQRRHRAGAVRDDPRLSGGEARRRPGRRCDGLDRADRPCPVIRSGAAQSGVRFPSARLRHQGRVGAAARVAARRTRRRPDADLGGALRACCSTSPSTPSYASRFC